MGSYYSWLEISQINITVQQKASQSILTHGVGLLSQ